MFKYLFGKKKSVVFTWLLSYIAILLVPIAIAGFMHIEAERIIELEVNKSNNFLLKRARQRMDGLLEDMNKLYLEIAFNSRIQEISSIRSIGGMQQYSIKQAYDDLKSYKMSSNSIYTFYIYFHNMLLFRPN